MSQVTNKFKTIVVLCTLALGSAAAAEAPPNLRWFGYTGANFSQLSELAPFSNFVLLNADDPLFADKLATANDLDLLAIPSLNRILFCDDAVARSLCADHEARWAAFVETYQPLIGHNTILAFYLADEPHWQGISEAELRQAHDLVKSTYPSFPTLTVYAVPGLDAITQTVPSDWVAFNQYGVFPTKDASYQSNFARLQAAMGPETEILLVGDSWFAQGVHGEKNLAKRDLKEIAEDYMQFAADHPEVIGIGWFAWELAGDALGLRSLPGRVRRKHFELGAQVSGKCGIPAAVATLQGEHVSWHQGCRFFATVEALHPNNGSTIRGTAKSIRSEDTSFFWFFAESNIEIMVKVVDGTAANGHYWVYIGGTTDLDTTVSITDTTTGQIQVYRSPPGPFSTVADNEAFQGGGM